jgi:hypothetical protein
LVVGGVWNRDVNFVPRGSIEDRADADPTIFNTSNNLIFETKSTSTPFFLPPAKSRRILTFRTMYRAAKLLKTSSLGSTIGRRGFGHKELLFGQDGRAKLAKGVETLAKAVATTLGPKGRNVLIGTFLMYMSD